MLNFLVLYTSTTGNTKKVAAEIFNALPGTSKNICDLKDFHHDQDAELYFIGFGANRGTCDISVISLLSGLHNKKIALFGTCGMGNSHEYFHLLANNVSVFIPDDCEYLGSYLCQGKMPDYLRQKYTLLLEENPSDAERIQDMIQIFDQAQNHPDDEDLLGAQTFACNILKITPLTHTTIPFSI